MEGGTGGWDRLKGGQVGGTGEGDRWKGDRWVGQWRDRGTGSLAF